MANPTPNSFVSNYKEFLVRNTYSVNGKPVWDVYTRVYKKEIGKIVHNGDTWAFYPKTNEFNHLQLLDLAAAIKAVEKRGNLPNFY